MKSSIFLNKNILGVGQLYVKPLDEGKASILVRADNTLGNILLNILIPSAPAPAPVGKNNCLVTVSYIFCKITYSEVRLTGRTLSILKVLYSEKYFILA